MFVDNINKYLVGAGAIVSSIHHQTFTLKEFQPCDKSEYQIYLKGSIVVSCIIVHTCEGRIWWLRVAPQAQLRVASPDSSLLALNQGNQHL